MKYQIVGKNIVVTDAIKCVRKTFPWTNTSLSVMISTVAQWYQNPFDRKVDDNLHQTYDLRAEETDPDLYSAFDKAG